MHTALDWVTIAYSVHTNHVTEQSAVVNASARPLSLSLSPSLSPRPALTLLHYQLQPPTVRGFVCLCRETERLGRSDFSASRLVSRYVFFKVKRRAGDEERERERERESVL